MHLVLRLDTGPINKFVQFCLQCIEECYVSVRTPLQTSNILYRGCIERKREKPRIISLIYFLSHQCHSEKFQTHCIPVIPLSFCSPTNKIIYFYKFSLKAMNKRHIHTAVSAAIMLNQTCSCILQMKDGFLCSL